MAAGKTSTYDEKEIKKLQENIKKTKEFIDAAEKLGCEMPKLKKSIKTLEVAINTGADVAQAAHQASEELKIVTADLEKACQGDAVCEAGVARQWQGRAVKWTLDPKNDNSVVSKSMDKTMARYAPEFICKMFDGCAKELKKQEKAKKK